MPRRVNLPGANELFRATQSPRTSAAPDSAVTTEGSTPAEPPIATRRVRHDEKITVYISADELIALEQARLSLRRTGVVADRGLLVRTAVAMALHQLTEHGAESEFARRLADS